jgi:hypothetical protein
VHFYNLACNAQAEKPPHDRHYQKPGLLQRGSMISVLGLFHARRSSFSPLASMNQGSSTPEVTPHESRGQISCHNVSYRWGVGLVG